MGLIFDPWRCVAFAKTLMKNDLVGHRFLVSEVIREVWMGLFFAFLLIGLPAAALIYDFRRGGDNSMFSQRAESQTKASE